MAQKILLPYDGSIYSAYHILEHLRKSCIPSVFGFSDKDESMCKTVEAKGLKMVKNVRDYFESVLWNLEKKEGGEEKRYNIDWRFRFQSFKKGSLGYVYTRGINKDDLNDARVPIRDSRFHDEKKQLFIAFVDTALELKCNTLFWPAYEWGSYRESECAREKIEEHGLQVIECTDRPTMKNMVEEFYSVELENEEMRGEIKFLEDGYNIWDMIFACECDNMKEHELYVKDVYPFTENNCGTCPSCVDVLAACSNEMSFEMPDPSVEWFCEDDDGADKKKKRNMTFTL